MDEIKSTKELYQESLIAFHNLAKEHGMAVKGAVTKPDLKQAGEDFLFFTLHDKDLVTKCNNEPKTYYLLITRIAFNAGIAYAEKWHTNYEYLENGHLLHYLPDNNAAEYVEPMIEREFHKSKEEWNSYETLLFEKWKELMKPYWETDHYEYRVSTVFLALFQLGVSTYLSNYGF